MSEVAEWPSENVWSKAGLYYLSVQSIIPRNSVALT